MSTCFDPVARLNFYVANKRYTIDGLHVAFDVALHAGNTNVKVVPNTAKISVWNLATATRNLFCEAHQGVELYAGYGSDVGMIFAGQTTNVISERDGVDWRTDIYAGDGIKQYETRFFLKSYKAGTPVIRQLKDLCDFSELPYTIDTYILDNGETILSGETYAGRLQCCLDDLCKDHGWQWSILHGRLEVYQKDSPFRADPEAVFLSSDTGLLGSPVVIDRTADEPPVAKQDNKNKSANEAEVYDAPKFRLMSVQMTSCLNHRIKPKRLVQLKSYTSTTQLGGLMTDPTQANRVDLSGLYIAKTVQFRGDNFGGPFETVVTADMND